MAWLESHQSLGEHPKTKKLCRLLGISKREAVGTLHLLWWWALDYAEDGDLSRYDDLDIAIGADWDQPESPFVEALVSSGFLERVGDRLLIHDWMDYAGKLIERREKNAQRMRDARAGSDLGTTKERATNVQRTMHTRAELQNQTKPTEQTKPENTPVNPPAKAADGHGDKPKTRTEKQKVSDAIYERRMLIVAAYFRGLGVEEGTLPWNQRKGQALAALTPVILESPECVPEIIEPLTRYTKAAFQWRNGKKTPLLVEVLAAFAEWESEGRPDHPPPKAINGRASPPDRPTKNGRVGYTSEELDRMSRGDPIEPTGSSANVIDAYFSVDR